MTVMYSCLSSQIAADRHPDVLADASAGRLARQARAGRQEAASAGWTRWRHSRLPRPATQATA